MNFTTGFCSCLGRFYDDGVTEYCQKCHYSCLTCSDLLFCDSCNSSAYRTYNASTLMCDCLATYNDNGVEELCSSCQYTCATCSSPSVCLTCNSAYHRTFDGLSNCPCDLGYYDNHIALCASCHYSC